jgi:prepilin-type N-terminal cleavage/methylation domain-containing protein
MLSGEMHQQGFTLIELLTVILVVSILTVTAIPNFKAFDAPLSQSAFATSHMLRLARARAISTTSYIRIAPDSLTTIAAFSVVSCSPEAEPSMLSELRLELEDGIQFDEQNWYICFTPRGLSDAHISFSISNGAQRKDIQVALGGGVRID